MLTGRKAKMGKKATTKGRRGGYTGQKGKTEIL